MLQDFEAGIPVLFAFNLKIKWKCKMFQWCYTASITQWLNSPFSVKIVTDTAPGIIEPPWITPAETPRTHVLSIKYVKLWLICMDLTIFYFFPHRRLICRHGSPSPQRAPFEWRLTDGGRAPDEKSAGAVRQFITEAGRQKFPGNHVENECSRIKMCERISSSLISNISSLKRADTNLIISVCQAYMTIHFNKVEYPVPRKTRGFLLKWKYMRDTSGAGTG